MSTTNFIEEFTIKFNTLQDLTNAYEAIIKRSKEGFDKMSQKLNEWGVVYKKLDSVQGILVKAEDIPEVHLEEFYAMNADFSAEKIFIECGAVKESFENVLYLLKTRNNGDFYVLAENSTLAEQALMAEQDMFSLSYPHCREVVEITVVAKELKPASKGGTSMFNHGGRLIIANNKNKS